MTIAKIKTVNIFSYKFIFFIMMLILACDSSDTVEEIDLSQWELPFKEGNVWLYKAKYIKDEYFENLEQNADERPVLVEDTIKIILRKVIAIDPIKDFYFNHDLNRRWWKDLILNKYEGYQNYYSETNNYLLKYPIKLGHKWKNKIMEGFEVYEYTNLDTTITTCGIKYSNCIELTMKFGYNYWPESDSGIVKIYLNEKYGLIYYYDPLLEEEYKLLKFEEYR